MDNIAFVSANLDIPAGCPIECRLNVTGGIEFTLGTWKGGVDLIFDRHALQRFTELATRALDEPVSVDPDTARPVLRSPV